MNSSSRGSSSLNNSLKGRRKLFSLAQRAAKSSTAEGRTTSQPKIEKSIWEWHLFTSWEASIWLTFAWTRRCFSGGKARILGRGAAGEFFRGSSNFGWEWNRRTFDFENDFFETFPEVHAKFSSHQLLPRFSRLPNSAKNSQSQPNQPSVLVLFTTKQLIESDGERKFTNRRVFSRVSLQLGGQRNFSFKLILEFSALFSPNWLMWLHWFICTKIIRLHDPVGLPEWWSSFWWWWRSPRWVPRRNPFCWLLILRKLPQKYFFFSNFLFLFFSLNLTLIAQRNYSLSALEQVVLNRRHFATYFSRNFPKDTDGRRVSLVKMENFCQNSSFPQWFSAFLSAFASRQVNRATPNS